MHADAGVVGRFQRNHALETRRSNRTHASKAIDRSADASTAASLPELEGQSTYDPIDDGYDAALSKSN